MQSLELLLDEELEAEVRSDWDALLAADLPSQARHTGASNRPHITLLVRDVLPRLDDPGGGWLPLPIRLGPLVLLGRSPRIVLARSVVPTEALLALHTGLRTRVGPGDDAPFSSPGAWTPHVTLARRVAPELLTRVLDVLDPDAEPTGSAVRIRHWDGVEKAVTDLH